jgi:uncharacterized protein YjdB
MRFKSTDNKLYFTAGTASTIKQGQKVPVEYIHYNDPKCGSYIDPRGFLVLPNFNSISGDKDERMALYIVNGSIEVDTLANVITIVNGYCLDTDVSATSVVITGCLTDTELVEGATRQLTATVLPTGAVQTGTWSTDDELIATVSVGGLVTAVAEGTVTITFTSTDGGFTASCVLTIVAA